MKILLHGNSPMSGTGYGVQMKMLVPRLVADGFEVAISCNHGQDAGIGFWTTPQGVKVPLYPRLYSPAGEDIIHGHAQHFFQGNPSQGWIIPLIDVWAFQNPYLKEFNVAAWAPVDHLDVPPDVNKFFVDSGAVPIAMSQHGREAMQAHGLDPVYIPLAVDTKTFKPTNSVRLGGAVATGREMMVSRTPFAPNGLDNAFVVGMVAMNKGNVLDRKGWSEAFYAFGRFARNHPDAVLYVHTNKYGAQGFNLPMLAQAAGIPPGQILFSDQYAYNIGFTTEMMVALYSAFDVLLAPSHGEGFCVPIIEAQACGTPVIASAATAQPELVCPDAGWLVAGQPVWDESQSCPAFMPSIADIVHQLEQAYATDLPALEDTLVEWTRQWDFDHVYETYWRPFLASLALPEPIADKVLMDKVAVVVPVMQRPHAVAPFVEAFNRANDGTANLYFVCDPDDDDEIAAVKACGLEPLISDRGHTFAKKANYAYTHTTEDWLFICGDDCEPTPGFLAEARKLSDRYDVIGTRDSEPGRVRNPLVAQGRHADHWFTRRAYIDDPGSCLEGPGVFCPEAFYHWWVDKEVVGLAQARGVYGHADLSVVVHHHPGFDGNEQARRNDPVYMKAVEWAERDQTTWFKKRLPLIEEQRVARRGMAA